MKLYDISVEWRTQLTFRKCDKVKQCERTKVPLLYEIKEIFGCYNLTLVFHHMCIVHVGRRMGQAGPSLHYVCLCVFLARIFVYLVIVLKLT